MREKVFKLKDFKPLEDFGCYVYVYYGVLYYIPMLISGEPSSIDDMCVVSEPDCQEFLDAVNSLFGSKFKLKDFGCDFD